MATTASTTSEQAAERLAGAEATIGLTFGEAAVRADMAPRVFGAGSVGYGFQGKLDGPGGMRLQVNVTATVIGSGSDPEAPKRAATLKAEQDAKAAAKAAAA